MVKIKTSSELKEIQESDYGFLLTISNKSKVTIHKTNCKLILEKDFKENLKKENNSNFYWFSSFSRAEKEFSNLVNCEVCKP